MAKAKMKAAIKFVESSKAMKSILNKIPVQKSAPGFFRLL